MSLTTEPFPRFYAWVLTDTSFNLDTHFSLTIR